MAFPLLKAENKEVLLLLLEKILVSEHPITNPHEEQLFEEKPWRKAISFKILRTCRQINALGSEIFWKRNQFRFSMDTRYAHRSPDMLALKQFLQQTVINHGAPVHNHETIISKVLQNVSINATYDPCRVNHIDVVHSERLNLPILAWNFELLQLFAQLRCRFDTMAVTLDGTLESTPNYIERKILPLVNAGGLLYKIARWKLAGPLVQNVYARELTVNLLTDKKGDPGEEMVPDFAVETVDAFLHYLRLRLSWGGIFGGERYMRSPMKRTTTTMDRRQSYLAVTNRTMFRPAKVNTVM
jgi:hypothetical protein